MWCCGWHEATAFPPAPGTLRSRPAPCAEWTVQGGRGTGQGSFPSRVGFQHPQNLIQSKVEVCWRNGAPKDPLSAGLAAAALDNRVSWQ